jgi:hypothetical protein
MFAVIFEVQPKPHRWDQSLNLAGQLRPELERIDGSSRQRYSSRRTKGRLLSLSIWADEVGDPLGTHAMHHGVQKKGRFEVFEDYHLRVGEITADTDVPPSRTLTQNRFDTTEVGAAKLSASRSSVRLRCPKACAWPAAACSTRSCSKASPRRAIAVSGLLARCGCGRWLAATRRTAGHQSHPLSARAGDPRLRVGRSA